MTVIMGIIWLIFGTEPIMATVGTDNYGGLSGWGLALAITVALDLSGGVAT
jgi:hypothetical protein